MDDVTGAADAGTGTSTGTASTGASSSTSGTTSGTGGDTDTSGTSAGAPSCPSVYEPVCGKDGETYDNACVVPEGVGIRREGPCVGDCEGSCTVVGSPQLSLLLSLVTLLLLRLRG